jgi:hypothetical protein
VAHRRDRLKLQRRPVSPARPAPPTTVHALWARAPTSPSPADAAAAAVQAVTCPICFASVRAVAINHHLDTVCAERATPAPAPAPTPVSAVANHLPMAWSSLAAPPPMLLPQLPVSPVADEVRDEEEEEGEGRAPWLGTPDTAAAAAADGPLEDPPRGDDDPTVRYYERHLLDVLAQVEARHGTLLTAEEHALIVLLRALPRTGPLHASRAPICGCAHPPRAGDERRLCVRLYQRKRRWVGLASLAYADLADPAAAAHALCARGLLQRGPWQQPSSLGAVPTFVPPGRLMHTCAPQRQSCGRWTRSCRYWTPASCATWHASCMCPPPPPPPRHDARRLTVALAQDPGR